MALWQVNDKVVYSDGALSVSPDGMSGVQVIRHFYKVPFTNIGKGGILKREDGKYYHTPSWIEVHPKTTMEDIIVEKDPFEELFVEPKTWTFKSASSDKEYKVKINAKGNLSCDCFGYIAHKKCKHIKQVKENEKYTI